MAYNKYENFFRWAAHKLKIQESFNKNNQKGTKHPRGAVYTCYFGENIGHEKSRLEARPCVIVSTDGINFKSTNVIVVPLSKDIKYKNSSKTVLKYDTHYVLRKSKYNKLKFDSVAQCEDIRCVSKARLGKYITKLDNEDMDGIRKRIKRTLQL